MVCRYLRMNPEKVKLKDLEAYEILIEDDGKRRVYLITEPFPIGDSDDDVPPIKIITILCISQADDDVVGKMRGFLINGYFLFLEPREAFTYRVKTLVTLVVRRMTLSDVCEDFINT